MSRHTETSGVTRVGQQGLRLCRGVAWRDEGTGLLLYHAHRDTLYEGNGAAAQVLRMLAAGLAPAGVSDALARDYGIPTEQAESDVAEFIESLAGEGLVVRP